MQDTLVLFATIPIRNLKYEIKKLSVIEDCINSVSAYTYYNGVFVFHLLQKKENSKRRKDDHNLSRKSKDKKVQLPSIKYSYNYYIITFVHVLFPYMDGFGDAFYCLYALLGYCLYLYLFWCMLPGEYSLSCSHAVTPALDT